MTLTIDLRAAALSALSANEAFKLRYSRTLKAAALAALLLTALLVWLWPDVAPRPYQLRASQEFQLIELPDTPLVDEPPAPAPPPRIPAEIEVAKPGEVPVDPNWENIILPVEPPRPSIPMGGDVDFVAASSKPVLQFQAKAQYPEIARRAGIEGTVIVKVLVGVDGRVDQAVIVQGANPIIDKEALLAARKCRFSPARQREMKVPVWVAVPYRFKLR